ncbi:MAG: hypothetical protein M0Q14_00445 [Tissierellaceae bacterium]|nr:hypothetical protein [Tissierellaceae bacterium]
MKKREGFIMIFIFIIFTISLIIGIAIQFVALSNLKQIKNQENNIKAYYLAYSGAEIAYAALLKPDSKGNKKIDSYNNSIINPEPINLDFDEDGIDDVSIKIKYDKEKDTIFIESIGILNDGDKTYTLNMSFSKQYPEIKLWE